MATPVLQIASLSKAYGGLRPLRLRRLSVGQGDRLVLAGFDQVTAEVFVNLVTGATLPEEGQVHIFGRATSEIVDGADWLATLDRFGLISERVVLLEHFTALQNIAMSLTLDVEPLRDDVGARAEALAAAAGLEKDRVHRPLADGGVAVRHRVRLARALATEPSVLLVEHPVAGLAPDEVAPLAGDITRVAGERGLAVIVLAADGSIATAFAPRVLTLHAGSGELTEAKGGLLGRLFGR